MLVETGLNNSIEFADHLFGSDPNLRSEWEVSHWLDWCQAEFGLQCLGPDLRGMPGSELCALDREAFLGLISDCTAGEILWEHLDTMRRGEIKPQLPVWLSQIDMNQPCRCLPYTFFTLFFSRV